MVPYDWTITSKSVLHTFSHNPWAFLIIWTWLEFQNMLCMCWTSSLRSTTCFSNDRRTAESDRVREANNVFNYLASLNLLQESSHLKQIITRFSATSINESVAGKMNRLHFILNCCQVTLLCGNGFSGGTKQEDTALVLAQTKLHRL